MKKIAVVTGTRAEYGLLRPLIQKIESSKDYNLNLIVTGMHLAPEFGETVNEIINDNLNISDKVEVLLSSDSDVGVAKSIGLGMISFSETFQRINPDLLIVLGDRFEILAACVSACVLKIPIAHIHGGETTEGAYDEAFRHSITKMSYLHFPSTEVYKKRIIQLGEDPNRVNNVGALGLENILNLNLLSKNEIYDEIKLKDDDEYFLVTFHPTTLEKINPAEQVSTLLNALLKFEKYKIVIAKANSDTNGRNINKVIDRYSALYPERFVTFYSLGITKYLSLMKNSKIVIGNSSSGIIEAPSIKVPSINIGDRQKGRIRSSSIFDCEIKEQEIEIIVNKVLSSEVIEFENCYGNGNTSDLIMDAINDFFRNDNYNLKKKFYDLGDINE